MRRVVVTGLGAITPLGVGLKQTWSRLIRSESGIVSTLPLGSAFAKLPSRVAGLVPQGNRIDGGWNSREWLEPGSERRIATFAQYAMACAQEALDDAGWAPSSDRDLEMTGTYIGSGIGSLDDAYDTSIAFRDGGYSKVSPLFVPRLLINLASGHISMRHGFRGPNHAATTACTTGLHAIGDAARMIIHGDADVMLAGGAESCIHPLSIAGFSRCRSLSTDHNDFPTHASRPFDTSRSGFVIAEGSGVVVLEEMEHARGRGARIYAEVAGYGLSSDAHHMTRPRPDGDGPVRAMRNALRNAGIAPGAVGYVNAHATGTVVGDAAENTAIKRVLLDDDRVAAGRAKRFAGEIVVSSTKGAMGHLLGAAGAVEAIVAIMAIHTGIVPPTLNLDRAGDPSTFRTSLDEYDCNYVPHTAQEHKIDVALTNSFGFGGTNASLCLTRFKG